jgi:hypothetical protein
MRSRFITAPMGRRASPKCIFRRRRTGDRHRRAIRLGQVDAREAGAAPLRPRQRPNPGRRGPKLAAVDWLRRQIGVVLQEMLFNRSIRDNIALADPACRRCASSPSASGRYPVGPISTRPCHCTVHLLREMHASIHVAFSRKSVIPSSLGATPFF